MSRCAESHFGPANQKSVPGGRVREFRSLAFALIDVVACVLMTVGLLKLVALAPQLAVDRTSTFLFCIGFFECVLAVWLLSGFSLQASRGIAILFYTGTLVYGAWLLAGGSTNCECFGPIRTHRLIAMAVSAGCIGSLIVSGKLIRMRELSLISVGRPWLSFLLGTALLVIVAIDCVSPNSDYRAVALSGSQSSLSATIEISPIPVNFFEPLNVQVPIQLVNHSSSYAVGVVGADFGCGAICEIKGLPVTVKPNETKILLIDVSRPGVPEAFWREAVAQYYDNKPSWDLTIPNRVDVRLFSDDAIDSPIECGFVIQPSTEFYNEWEQLKKEVSR
jgi:hypothetical protein